MSSNDFYGEAKTNRCMKLPNFLLLYGHVTDGSVFLGGPPL